MSQAILFLILAGIGAISRIYYRVMRLIIGRLKNRPAEITIEFFSVGLVALSVFAVAYFCSNGVVSPFMIISLAIGFVLTSLLI